MGGGNGKTSEPSPPPARPPTGVKAPGRLSFPELFVCVCWSSSFAWAINRRYVEMRWRTAVLFFPLLFSSPLKPPVVYGVVRLWCAARGGSYFPPLQILDR